MNLDDRKKDEQDMRDMLDVYRTMRNMWKWLPYIVAFFGSMVLLMIKLKDLLK